MNSSPKNQLYVKYQYHNEHMRRWLCLYVMETHPKFHNIMTLNAHIFNSQEDPNGILII